MNRLKDRFGGGTRTTGAEQNSKRSQSQRFSAQLNHLYPSSASPETQKKMLSTRVQCALALLSLALAISSISAAPSDAKLRQLLQRSLMAPAGKQELARNTLIELLSELAHVENEAIELDDMSRGVEQEDVDLELERAPGPVLAPRERKAGCKNFFWKTFTSC
ncbi:somatostatin-1A-like [Salvelinus fontinalis]|uniref:somatostatin-1A-like n=1 Tax=Salvelinus fontinalis TaxID=8038 RepID=UPI0024851DA5|nr:somatostatin-1A-like [Salvelinus fontinalis]